MKDAIITGQTVQKAHKGVRDNNFSVLRLIATLFVFAGHMGVILGVQPPLLGGFPLHELGVMILFMISGYLITMSWLSDPHPLRYSIRRFFRLWPPFAVMVLVMVFVTGPLVSELGVKGYFQSWYSTYLHNLRFYIIYAQPGVFTGLPVANATNGSLWTMPVEAALYVATPLLVTLLRVKGRSKWSFRMMTVLTGAAVVFDLFLRTFFPGDSVVVYATDWIAAYHLITMYLIGILFTYEEARRYLNVQVGCVAVCMMLFTGVVSDPLQHVLLYLAFPYFIFSFAFAPKPAFKNFGRKVDLSYGIYLYGFFFQQLAVYLQQRNGINLGYMKTFAVSMLFTLAAALLSWYLVEKPAHRFGRFLIGKMKR